MARRINKEASGRRQRCLVHFRSPNHPTVMTFENLIIFYALFAVGMWIVSKTNGPKNHID